MYTFEELDIDFYSSPNCGYCRKAKELLNKGGYMNKLNLKDNEPLPSGVYGVPHFHSKKTNVSHTGCPKSIDDLVNTLNNKSNSKNTDVSDNNSDSNNTGMIVGISFISAILLLILAFYGYRYFKNK